MSEYQVSARKYRPQTFDTVVGQSHITTTLKNAIRSGHLAHAYLFTGPRGVGKTTCARILARTINCEQPTPDVEACGTCATCRSFSDNAALNVFEMDAASNNSVDDIRDLVNQVRYAPQQGRYKVYIIDEVHMLSAAAFNAFLKTLEEPPGYAIFILATTEKHKILPTILSRCQIFDFRRITTSDTVAHLQGIAAAEGLEAEEEALHVIAQKSEGCMRDALSMLDRLGAFAEGRLSYAATMEHLALLDADFYFDLTDKLLAEDLPGTLLMLDAVLAKGFEGDAVLSGLGEHFRSLLLCKDARMAGLLDVPPAYKRAFHEKAQQAPPSYLLSALSIIGEADFQYRDAPNKRMHTELCLIRLAYLRQATGAAAVESGGGMFRPDAGPAVVPPSARPAPAPERLPNVATVPAPAGTAAFPGVAGPVAVTVGLAAPRPAPADIPAAHSKAQATSTPPTTAQVSTAPAAAVQLAPPSYLSVSAPGTGRRRISKELLDGLDAPAAEAAVVKDLCADMVDDVFGRYVQTLRDEGASTLYAQFGTMQAECAGADEVHIVAPNAFAESFVAQQRDRLVELFSAATGGRVRLTTEVRVDADAAAAQPMVLSKQELFDAMARKNPQLVELKDGMGLQIDFG